MNKCDYGCGKEGRYFFKTPNKWCCSSHTNKCSGKKLTEEKAKLRGAKTAITRSKLNSDGKTSYTESSQKTILTKRKNNIYQIASEKMNQTKKSKMIDGKTIEERAVEKRKETMNSIRENGKTGYENAAHKLKIAMNTLYDDTITLGQHCSIKGHETRRGIPNSYRDSGIKRINTMINDIDENGLNALERSFLKANHTGIRMKKYKETDILYQGSYEKSFLEQLEAKHSISWINSNVSRGDRFKYKYNGRESIYLPDFLIENTYYEVKSAWTWNMCWTVDGLLERNIAKLNSVISSGFGMILVLDHQEIVWPDAKWIASISSI